MTAPCPHCGGPRPTTAPACPRCALPLVGPAAERLGLVDRSLRDLDAAHAELWRDLNAVSQELGVLGRRRADLDRRRLDLERQRVAVLGERAAALTALRASGTASGWTTAAGVPGLPGVPGVPGLPGVPGPAGGAVPARRAAEASPTSVQNVLLALGGILLGVAAIVFTVVAWGQFGIGGRAVILAGMTALALAVPVALHRFGLTATAETIAVLALLLVALDGYAAWYVGLVPPAVDGRAYAGIVAAVVAACGATYPFAVPLRSTRPIAAVAAQPVLPLVAWAYEPDVAGWALVALVVAAADLALVAWTRRRAAGVAVVAGLGGGFAATVAGLAALAALVLRSGTSGWIVAASVFGGLAGLALLAGEVGRNAVVRGFAAGLAPLLVVVGGYGLWLRLGDDGGDFTALAVCALLVAVPAAVVREPWRYGAVTGAGLVTFGAALVPALATAGALLAPVILLPRVWQVGSVSEPLHRLPIVEASVDVLGATAVVVAALSVLVTAVVGRRAVPYLTIGAIAVLGLGVPWATDAPVWIFVASGATLALGLTAAGVLVRPRPVALAAFCTGLVLGGYTAGLSLVHQGTTLVVLGIATVLCGVLAAAARGRGRAAVLTGGALANLAGLVAAAMAAGPADMRTVGLAVLAAAVPALTVSAALRRPRPPSAAAAAVTGIVTAYAGGVTAAVTGDRVEAALVAAGAGAVAVIAAAVAVRSDPGRRLLAAAALPPALVAGLLLVAPVFALFTAPLGWLGAVWSGAPGTAAVLGPTLGWPGRPGDPVAVFALAILTAGAAACLGGRRWAAPAALPLVAAAAAEIPAAAAAHWFLGPAALLAFGTAAWAVAAWPSSPRPGGRAAGWFSDGVRAAAAVVAPLCAVTGVAWSLAAEAATLGALGAVLVVAGVAAAAGRDGVPRVVAAGVVGLAVPALAVAAAAAAGWRGHTLSYPLVGAAAVLLGAAAVAARWRPRVGLALEAAGAGTTVVALAFAFGAWRPVAITLTLLAALAGTVALREDRRWCVWLVPALGLGATWAWLAWLGARTPEYYTLPAAGLALAFGLAALRRTPGVSSWVALGPALAVGALPSAVLTAGADTLGPRALLLGIAALAVTLAGAATRRQAPFLIGTVTVLVVAGRALAQVWPVLADAVPAWVPLALGGVLLVAAGATYEQRRRDLRRLGQAVGRMR